MAIHKKENVFVLTITSNGKTIGVSAYDSLDAAKTSMYVDIIRCIMADGTSNFGDIQWHEDFMEYSAGDVAWKIEPVVLYSSELYSSAK